MRFFQPRYSLRTLLIAVTATALLLWGVPEWREYLRRKEFEFAACQLTTGIEPNLFELLPRHSYEQSITHTVFYDADRHAVKAIPIFYNHYWYCIYAHQEQLSAEDKQTATREVLLKARTSGTSALRGLPYLNNRWTTLRVYRLKPMPPGYVAQSKRGKKQVIQHPEMNLVDRAPREQYLRDFYEILTGRERRNLGIRYELIHADPPVSGN